MDRLHRLIAIAILAWFIVEAHLPALGFQDQPTFRGGVQSIEVDVRVVDRDGRVVRDLTKEDFILLDDGVAQTITAGTFIDLEAESPITRRLPGTFEPDVVTNIGTGRMWVMMVGLFGVSRSLAARFIENSLGPNDEVAVLSVFGTSRSAQAFTRSRERMLTAVERLRDDPPPPGSNLAQLAFDALGQVCNTLGRMGGRRKVVLLIDPPAIWIPGPRLISAFMAQRDALRCATRNNVVINVVSSMGMSTEFGGLTTMAALRALAEETGGDAIVNSNNYEGGFQRFVRDASAYYLLGYTPSIEHRDGEFHTISVRVNRPGVTVRARRGYYARDPDVGAMPSRTATSGGPSPELQRMLRFPLSANGIAVDLFTAPFRDGRTASVLLGAQLREADLVLDSREPLEVGYQGIANDGRISPGAFKQFTLELSPASRATVESTGLRFVDRMALAPGRHQVRFVVHQENGRTGMVVADVDVPDFSRDPVSVSGLLLASQQLATQPSLSSDAAIKRLLSVDPTAVRRFRRTDALTAYAEVYTNARTRIDEVRVRTTLAPAGNLRQTQDVVSRVVASEPDRAGHLVTLNLADVPEGDHVLTIEARAGRQMATRQVLFSVSER